MSTAICIANKAQDTFDKIRLYVYTLILSDHYY